MLSMRKTLRFSKACVRVDNAHPAVSAAFSASMSRVSKVFDVGFAAAMARMA